MEFIDGSEVTPAHGTLAALKRDRVAQRLLANFGWTDVQRSLDGAQYVLNMPRLNITAGTRPTEGVFQVSGWDELRINVFYGALTGQHGKYAATDWRVFVLGYSDYRSGVVKTDNRAAAIRNADADSIDIGTYGGHVLQIAPTATGPVDLLFWGALHQSGSWVNADAPRRRVCRRGRMAAGTAEADQAVDTRRLRLRVGRRQRGRRHALDVLPGAADAPNLRAHAVLQHDEQQGRLRRADRPKRVTVRSDIHALRLADPADLWYGWRSVPGNDLRLHRPAVEWPVHARYALRRQRRRHAHSARRRWRLRRLRGRRASDAGDLYER